DSTSLRAGGGSHAFRHCAAQKAAKAKAKMALGRRWSVQIPRQHPTEANLPPTHECRLMRHKTTSFERALSISRILSPRISTNEMHRFAAEDFRGQPVV